MDKIDAIMEDMLKRAKEIDQEGLCLGLFTIQAILEKHLQEPTEERGVKEIRKCLQCGIHYYKGTVRFCSAECCLKWNGMS